MVSPWKPIEWLRIFRKNYRTNLTHALLILTWLLISIANGQIKFRSIELVWLSNIRRFSRGEQRHQRILSILSSCLVFDILITLTRQKCYCFSIWITKYPQIFSYVDFENENIILNVFSIYYFFVSNRDQKVVSLNAAVLPASWVSVRFLVYFQTSIPQIWMPYHYNKIIAIIVVVKVGRIRSWSKNNVYKVNIAYFNEKKNYSEKKGNNKLSFFLSSNSQILLKQPVSSIGEWINNFGWRMRGSRFYIFNIFASLY